MSPRAKALTVFAVVLAAALSGVPSAFAQVDDAKVLAVVDGTDISVGRFNTSYALHLIRTGRNDTPQERHLHLGNLIDAHLLAQEAKRRGLDGSDAYRTYADRQVRKVVAGRYYESHALDSVPELSEAEVRAAFRNSKASLQVRHLLYHERDEADRSYQRLEAGEDFLALANEAYGTASFDSLAGLIGEAPYFDLDDAFAEVAFSLPPGSYSAPVRSRYGWHIVRVEGRFDDPLITESEFAYRRESVHQKEWHRRFRMAGDRFVQAEMGGLNVEVDAAGLLMLQDVAYRALDAEAEQASTPRLILAEEEAAAIEEELTPETVLATYMLDGEAMTFTAADYVTWLDDLPRGEVRNRTGASVGRALRNEVMARRGFERRLELDPVVVEEIQHRTAMYLADEMRQHVGETERVEATEEQLREGFERLGYRKLKEATADYWLITFSSMEEAAATQEAIAAGDAPENNENYEYFAAADLSGRGEILSELRRARLGVPILAAASDGTWRVFAVEDRTLSYTTFEEARPAIERALAPYLPEQRLRMELRESAEIYVDAELFEQMMRLDRGA